MLCAVTQIKSAPQVKLMKVMDSMIAVKFKPAQPKHRLEDTDMLDHMLYVSYIF